MSDDRKKKKSKSYSDIELFVFSGPSAHTPGEKSKHWFPGDRLPQSLASDNAGMNPSYVEFREGKNDQPPPTDGT